MIAMILHSVESKELEEPANLDKTEETIISTYRAQLDDRIKSTYLCSLFQKSNSLFSIKIF